LGGCDREKVLRIASLVLHLLATETPSAKQQSFGAHNPADLSMVSIADMPISLANAFESPVQSDNNGGYRSSSIEALHNYWDGVHKGYGLEERCAEFCIEGVEIPEGICPKSTLEDLKNWICYDGKDL
jgi:CRISPR system Cascade subunit CasC